MSDRKVAIINQFTMFKNSFEIVIILFSILILFDSFLCDTITTSTVLSVYHETTRRGGAVRYMNIESQKIPTIASESMKDKIGQTIHLKITPLFNRLKSYQETENTYKLSFSNKFGIVLSFLLILMQLPSMMIQRRQDDVYDYKESLGRFRWFSSLIVIVILIMITFYAS